MQIDTGYRPRPLQAEIHRSLHRFNVLVCHRRFGKTVLCINELIDQALRNGRDHPMPQYGYVAPLYKQAKAVAWDYLVYYTKDFPERKEYSSELRVDFMGRRIRLFGADSPDALRGIYLDGVVLDEFGQMQPGTWDQVIRPTLSDYKGWALFIGTAQGHNEFHEKYQNAKLGFINEDTGERELLPDWYAQMYKASQTDVLDRDELISARNAMGPEAFAQEYECDFEAAIKGAYYGKLMKDAETEDRIAEVRYDPNVPVNTCWDLGYGDSTAIWFYQLVGNEIHWIDYYENSQEPITHYAHVIRERPDQWPEARNVIWGEHLIPHDGNATELGSGKTRVETLFEVGFPTRVVQRQRLDDGINAVRKELPRSWFDAVRCRQGIEALKQYATNYDDAKKSFNRTPKHDWTSHAADAFRTGCMGMMKPHVWEPLDLPKSGIV